MKILLLEDNQDDTLLIKHELRKGNISYIIEQVDTRESFIEALTEFRPDVILSDHSMPNFNSKEALRILFGTKLAVPFILVTGMVSDEYAISCIREGADDYLLKSNLSRLPVAIRAALKKRILLKIKRIAHHNLKIQNEQLSKTNKELDSFLYSVSHNLRGPIASIMGLLNLAKTINKNAELNQLHEMMSLSILKLDDTLKDILICSQNSRSELHLEEINWEKIIQTTFEKLLHLIDPNEIVRFINLETSAPFFSDEYQLSIIFNNLLSNSIQYRNRENEFTLGIEIKTSAAVATIVIKDNGVGISQEIIPKIFDMFFRGNEMSSGAGLGLYITREIITRMNGSIEMQSILGRGSTVTIRLPNRLPR